VPGGGFIRLLDKSFKNLLDLAGDHILALELLQNLLTAKERSLTERLRRSICLPCQCLSIRKCLVPDYLSS